MNEENQAKYLVNVQKQWISQWEKFSGGTSIVIIEKIRLEIAQQKQIQLFMLTRLEKWFIKDVMVIEPQNHHRIIKLLRLEKTL